MATNQSLWGYFIHAGPVVKFVMCLLFAASIASWTFIFQRVKFFKQAKLAMQQFEQQFWSGGDLTEFYKTYQHQTNESEGLRSIFLVGFCDFLRLKNDTQAEPAVVMETVQRAMRIAYAKESDKMEAHIGFLATVGSTSPYVGLFGTVWGIMAAFHALGSASQATIAMVAPGISEALVATALGLFAAIPAVVGYNRFNNSIARLQKQYETFQEEFSNILQRQLHTRLAA